MEGLYNFYADHGVRYTSHAFNTSCQDFEVTDALIGVETIRLLDSNIDNWLRTQDGSSGLHMVWVPLLKDTMPWRYEIRESTFDAISKHFHVEKALRYGSTAAAGFANFRTGNVTSYSAFLSDLLVFAWSFDASTGTTRGICLGDPWIISTAQNLLPYQSALIGHPMAVGYMVIIILGTLMDRDLLRENRNIAEVENRTGYHGWKKSFAGVAKGEYATLSARMSGCATSLAGQQRIAKVSREALAFVSTISSEHHMNGYSQFLQERISLSAKTMKDFDTILGTRLDVQESQLEFLKQRTQIQLTALFNLIAQKDAKLNIAIAKDSRTLASASKRDSSSMKTLAAVTVAFLPATFVASLFAMPLLNWNASQGSPVINGRFWIYWAVTAPLTITTLIIWLTWTHRQSLLHRAQDRKDRDRLVDEMSTSTEPTLDGH